MITETVNKTPKCFRCRKNKSVVYVKDWTTPKGYPMKNYYCNRCNLSFNRLKGRPILYPMIERCPHCLEQTLKRRGSYYVRLRHDFSYRYLCSNCGKSTTLPKDILNYKNKWDKKIYRYTIKLINTIRDLKIIKQVETKSRRGKLYIRRVVSLNPYYPSLEISRLLKKNLNRPETNQTGNINTLISIENGLIYSLKDTERIKEWLCV